MKKIELTQGKFTMVDDEDFEKLNVHKWQYGSRGYAIRGVHSYKNGKRVKQTIWMHRVILDTPSGFLTDHINGNKLDNRRANLRIVTSQQNVWNSNIPSHNTSGYKGVSETKRNLAKKWEAYIILNNKKQHLGYFKTREEAASAYNEAATPIFQEYARLNSLIFFEYEYLPTMEQVREKIKNCESQHTQQVAYSTFHDALTQICYGCKKIRSSLSLTRERK